MEDLISVIAQCRAKNLTEKEIKNSVANSVLKELKQMSVEEFATCLESASFNTKTYSYEILLIFPAVTNK